MKPAHAVFAKNLFPIDVAPLDLASGCVASIGHAFRTTNAKPAFSEIQSVTHRASDAVIIAPLNVVHIHATLHDEILYQTPHFIVCKCCDHTGLETKTSAQAARHIVFAAAFPYIELASRAYPTVAGIEAQHNFPQRNHIVPTLIGGLDIKNGHRLRRV